MFVFFFSEAKQEWRKKGDFKAMMSTYQHGGITEKVKYTNQNENSVLKKIELYSEHPGELRMWLKIAPSEFRKVEQYLVANGFPRADIGMACLNIYEIQPPNVRYLADFLHVVKHFANDLDDVSNEIIKNIEPYMYNEPTITGWTKDGSLLNHPYETYISTLPSSKIDELTLSQNTVGGDIRLYVKAKQQHRKNFFSEHAYSINSKTDLEKALQELAKVDNTVAPMMHSMISSYCHRKPFGSSQSWEIRVTPAMQDHLERLKAFLGDLQPSLDIRFAIRR